MGVLLANNATSTLVASILAADTTLTVQSGDAGLFPAPGAGEWFPLTLVDAAGNMEIVRVTARSAGAMTVVRGQEGTSALDFAAGSRADLRLTKAAIDDRLQVEFASQEEAEAGVAEVKAMNALRTKQAIAKLASSFAIGDMLMTARDPGAGWLRADGSLKDAVSYAALYAVVGKRYAPLSSPLVLSKLTDPAIVPPDYGMYAAWSPDGRYLAVTHGTSPFVTIYDWSSGSPVKIANPANLPPGEGRGLAWSPDGRYLAVAHDYSPCVTIYDWQTSAPVKIANPATLPTGSGSGASWSADGRYLAISHSSGPRVTIYDWQTGTPVKIANPATLPPNTGNQLSWSPDNRYLAVPHASSPYVTIYDWQTGAPVKIANPATLPIGDGRSSAWSANGRYLALAHASSPYVTIYDWQTGAPVKIADPATLPTGAAFGVVWSPDGRYLALAHATSPYVTIYDWQTGAPVKIANPATLPTGDGRGLAWSPDGRNLVVMHTGSTPYLALYGAAIATPSGQFYLPKVAAAATAPATYIKAT